MDLVNSNGRMEPSIKDSGNRARCMETEKSLLLKEKILKGYG